MPLHIDYSSQEHLQIGLLFQQTFPWGRRGWIQGQENSPWHCWGRRRCKLGYTVKLILLTMLLSLAINNMFPYSFTELLFFIFPFFPPRTEWMAHFCPWAHFYKILKERQWYSFHFLICYLHMSNSYLDQTWYYCQPKAFLLDLIWDPTSWELKANTETLTNYENIVNICVAILHACW